MGWTTDHHHSVPSADSSSFSAEGYLSCNRYRFLPELNFAMDCVPFHDGNIARLIDHRSTDLGHGVGFQGADHSLQMHSSLIRRLSLEREMEGHTGCVNTIAWNSQGSLLISGSVDQRISIWRYSTRKLLHCIETGHTCHIFSTNFIPETSDELVASGAGDCEVRVFNISHLSGRQADPIAVTPYAHFQCHTKRVKKLAVEVGNPNVVWSASEDGTLRQHDFREACSCPLSGPSERECRSVLLDLRCGKKKSLSDPPNGTLTLKSCDISVTRPHLVLVGGSDAFARLYDRRMLPTLSSCNRRCSHPPCVNYFCPMHLSECTARSDLHLTHVAFSPNGEEVVISYSGEHIYLFDVNHGTSRSVQYTSGDIAKQWSFSSILNGIQFQTSENIGESSCATSRTIPEHDRCRKLLQTADRCLKEGDNYYHGLELCNEILDGQDCSSDQILKHDCLCTRSHLLLKRKWKNDAHMAFRDLNQALRIDNSSFRALYHLSEALVELGKPKEALDFALAAQILVPSHEVALRVETIRNHLAAGNLVMVFSREKLVRTLCYHHPKIGILFYHPIKETGQSNRVREGAPRSLDLPIRNRADFSGEAGSSKCSRGSFTMQNEKEAYKSEATVDMKQRFVGHCNMGTDIKQASFLGQKGEYIASGSDDGRWLIWEKKTGRLINMLLGDEAVVNCIQCHPFDSVVATSGIDDTIKIWTPSASVPSFIDGGFSGPVTAEVLEAMECNQHHLTQFLGPHLPGDLLERLGMPDSVGGSFERVQCSQS